MRYINLVSIFSRVGCIYIFGVFREQRKKDWLKAYHISFFLTFVFLKMNHFSTPIWQHRKFNCPSSWKRLWKTFEFDLYNYKRHLSDFEICQTTIPINSYRKNALNLLGIYQSVSLKLLEFRGRGILVISQMHYLAT